MTLKSNESLLNGKYIIERVLGQGGFGSVYLARDTIIGRPVAIKEMNPLLAEDERMVRRFLIEGRATLQLRHPNIVEVHDVFSDRGSYYLAMEYCPGGALDERLDAKPMTASEALAVMDQICAGVAYSHSRGIVHCDIKPANVLFDADGVAKVTDFGVAYVSPEAMTRSWGTVGGFAAGTLYYMAPEQLDGARDDPRIDVYSLGAMLYEMVTGTSYLDFRSADTISDQVHNALLIKQGAPASLCQLAPGAPAWLDEIVLLALSKQPAARYPDAGALRAALQRAELSTADPTLTSSTEPLPPVAPDHHPTPPSVHRSDDQTISAWSWGLPSSAGPTRSTRPTWKWLLATGSGVLILAAVALRIIVPPPGGGGTTFTPDVITTQSTGTLIPTLSPAIWTSRPVTATQPPLTRIPTQLPATATVPTVISPATSTPRPETATSTPRPLTNTPTPGPVTSTALPKVITPTPTSVIAPILVSPADGDNITGVTTFSWLWPGPDLPANQAFEVRIWKDGQSDHYGATELVRSTSATFDVASAYAVTIGGSGTYLWTVAVVPVPYQSTGPEAPPRVLLIGLSGSGSDGATATPTRPP